MSQSTFSLVRGRHLAQLNCRCTYTNLEVTFCDALACISWLFKAHDRVENLLKGIILTIYSFDIE